MVKYRSVQRHNTPAAVVAAAASMLVFVTLAGCGSDADDTLGVQEFRDQSNEICARTTQEIGAVIGPVLGGPDPRPEQLQEALDTLLTLSRQAVVDLDELAAPASMQADVDAMLAAYRSANGEAEAQGPSFWETEGDPWSAANALAGELGLDVCAES